MAWTLISSWAYTSLVPNVDFNGLAGWSDIRVLLRGVTMAGSGQRSLRVSIDNGASFLSTSGDYVYIDSAGAESLLTTLNMHATASAAARSAEMEICGFNLASFKTAQALATPDATTVAGEVRFRVPAAMARAMRGTATLYRPSDSHADRTTALMPAVDGTIVIPTVGLASGRWQLRVQWSAGGRDYYFERDLRLP